MHPPYGDGVGYTYALYDPVALPELPLATFRCLVGQQDGSNAGDGILFRVAVVDAAGFETEIARQLVEEHTWMPIEGDLTQWAGQTIRIKLIGDAGGADDAVGDWACFADMRIERSEPMLGLSLHREPAELKHMPGPNRLDGVTLDGLRGATRGWIYYQACGLNVGPPFVSELTVNNVNIGQMLSGSGDESRGGWGEDVRVALSPEAIVALDARALLEINSTGGDSFKVRRFYIVVELADGRLLSSDIHTTAYTQPPSWAYAEGVLVPFGTPITADVRFDFWEAAR